MPQIIVKKGQAFNIYSSISDGPLFEKAVTEEQLAHYIMKEYGESGLRELPARKKRVLEFGSSSICGESAEEIIICNCVGDGEKPLLVADFIERYLTLETA